jgi:transcriptional regulator with XRE-family HTH domain
VINERQFFHALGIRIKQLRKTHGYTQEDMIGYGFSARHWQQIEAGRPITIRTLLRICETFRVKAGDLIGGLDRGIYK